MSEFEGRVALVTGGGRGIGAAISRRLARGGALVAVSDRDQLAADKLAGELVGEGLRAVGFAMDIGSAGSVASGVGAVETSLGPIEILVNNAGVSRFTAFLSISESEWDQVLGINLKGMFLTCRAVVPRMLERKAGRIVNMGSILSKQGGANFSHYSASKFGVVGLTQSLALEFAAHGITINCDLSGCPADPSAFGPLRR